jgi:hypothetical protein
MNHTGVPMRKPKGNRPNALKHGAFAKTAVLPLEDPEQFEELHSSLIEEWAPVGPTEQDAVFSIAMGMWRKRRLAHFINTARQKCKIDPNHAAYNETYALRVFSDLIAFSPDHFEIYLTTLTAHAATQLRQNFRRENFQSTSEWVHAIQKEVETVMLPAAARFDGSRGELIGQNAAFFTIEVIKDEVAVQERIDATIDRAVKRLIQTKAMKQMLLRISPNGTEQIQSSKPNGSPKVVNYEGRTDGQRSAGGS